jgi:predicted PurR-regulated permease PerM
MATAAGLGICFLLTQPFLPALAWALALSVLFTPFQRWLESKLTHSGLSASIAVIVIAFIVVAPVFFVGHNLVVQAAQGARLIEGKVTSGEWRRAIEAQPRLAPLADKIESELDLPGTVKSLTTWITAAAGTIVSGSMLQVISFGLIFYLLFFFLRDRRAVLASLHHLSPLSREETETLLHRVGDTIHATVYGTLVVSTLQGVLAGLMFLWLGLPAPLLWGVVMGILAMVPMLGAFVVWIPAALFLALEGSWGKALILTLWGMLIIGTIDNLLRPVLVGSRLKLHTVLAFISVVGGLMLFGPAGLILGPVALTITTVLLEVWRTPFSLAKPVPATDSTLLKKTAIERWENEGGAE